MFKKAASLLTMAAFLLFAMSCTMWRTREIDSTTGYPPDSREILSVVMASGEGIDFSKSNPGRLVGDKIVGDKIVVVSKRAEIAGPFVLVKRDANGRIIEVTDSSGRVHIVRNVLKEEPDRLTVLASYRAFERVSIPLSDVRLLRHKETNAVLTIAVAMLTVATLVIILWPSFLLTRDRVSSF